MKQYPCLCMYELIDICELNYIHILVFEKIIYNNRNSNIMKY